MDFNKLDRIELSMDDVEKVRKWYDYHYDGLKEMGEINFPFDECLIVVKNELKEHRGMKIPYDEIVLHYKMDKNLFNVYYNLYIQDSNNPDNKPTLSWVMDDEFIRTGEVNWKSGLMNTLMPKDVAIENVKYHTMLTFELFAYMTNVTENVIEKKVTRLITKKAKAKKGSNKKRQVKISVTKYTFDHERAESGKKYDRYTLAWTVRGHWRYYKKTGKRVWIKGHVRGQGNTADGKIYKI